MDVGTFVFGIFVIDLSLALSLLKSIFGLIRSEFSLNQMRFSLMLIGIFIPITLSKGY